jgi:hypothetical protein
VPYLLKNHRVLNLLIASKQVCLLEAELPEVVRGREPVLDLLVAPSQP